MSPVFRFPEAFLLTILLVALPRLFAIDNNVNIYPNTGAAATIFIYDNHTTTNTSSYDTHFNIIGMNCLYPQLTVEHKPQSIDSVTVYGNNQFIDTCAPYISSYSMNCNKTVLCLTGEHIAPYIIPNGTVYNLKLTVQPGDMQCGSYFMANVTLECKVVQQMLSNLTTFITTSSTKRTNIIRINTDYMRVALYLLLFIICAALFMCCIFSIVWFCRQRHSKSKLAAKNPLFVIFGFGHYDIGAVENIINDIEIITVLCKSRGFKYLCYESAGDETSPYYAKKIHFFRFLKKITDAAEKHDSLIMFVVGLGQSDFIWSSDHNIDSKNTTIKISWIKEKLQLLSMPKLIFIQTYLYQNMIANVVKEEYKDEEENKYDDINDSDAVKEPLQSVNLQNKGRSRSKQEIHQDSDFLVVHNKRKITSLQDRNGIFFRLLFGLLDKNTSIYEPMHSIVAELKQTTKCVIRTTLFKNMYIARKKSDFCEFDKYHAEIMKYEAESLCCIVLMVDIDADFLYDNKSNSLTTRKILEYVQALQHKAHKYSAVFNFAAISQDQCGKQIETILNHTVSTDTDTYTNIIIFLCGYMTNVNHQNAENVLKSYPNINMIIFTDYLVVMEPIDLLNDNDNGSNYIQMPQQNVIQYYIHKNKQKYGVLAGCRNRKCLIVILILWTVLVTIWSSSLNNTFITNVIICSVFWSVPICCICPFVCAYTQAPTANWNYCECNRCVCGKCTPWIAMCTPIVIVAGCMVPLLVGTSSNLLLWFLTFALPILLYGGCCSVLILICQRCRYRGCKYDTGYVNVYVDADQCPEYNEVEITELDINAE